MDCPKCGTDMDRHDWVVRGVYKESIYICPKCGKQVEEDSNGRY